MKRVFAAVMAMLLAAALIVPAVATDDSRNYLFDLTVDGQHEKNAVPGDTITVVFTLKRTDSSEDAVICAMQNEILYDPSCFEYVENSALMTPGIETTEIVLRDGMHEIYMNYLSLSGGTEWSAKTVVGSFQLRVTGMNGTATVSSRNCFVSTEDGRDCYASSCEDITVVLSGECTVRFDSRGGSAVEDQIVPFGELLKKPESPTREGLYFAGWYKDLDMHEKWNFDSDVVERNITLYARWSSDPAEAEQSADEPGGTPWWLFLLIGLPVVLAAAALFFVRTVRFETFGGTEIESVRVLRGKGIMSPAAPQKPGALFEGWYRDEDCSEPWVFESDTVERNMTLYARWL